MRHLTAAALLAAAVAAPATAGPPTDHVLDCFWQYVTVAEPVARPVRVEPDGTIVVTPSEATDKAAREVSRAVTFATCVA